MESPTPRKNISTMYMRDLVLYLFRIWYVLVFCFLQSAGAMTVAVGNLHSPKEVQGIAHTLGLNISQLTKLFYFKFYYGITNTMSLNCRTYAYNGEWKISKGRRGMFRETRN